MKQSQAIALKLASEATHDHGQQINFLEKRLQEQSLALGLLAKNLSHMLVALARGVNARELLSESDYEELRKMEAYYSPEETEEDE